MTRINLVPVEELADQHLFAEFREIKMIPKSLRRSLAAAWQKEFDKNDSNAYREKRRERAIEAVMQKIPKEYCLGKGHVSFFYNKGAYLRLRYSAIRAELTKRGINFDRTSMLDPDGIFNQLPDCYDVYYSPTPEALMLIRARIAEKIAQKPNWYRWTSAAA